EPPLVSGPYRIKDFEMGRSVTFERVPDYWGWHLPVNKGMFNFQYIRYITYMDAEVEFQAFKAGEFDYNDERSASRWATEYKGPQFDEGKIRQDLVQDYSPQGMQGLLFNLRRDNFKNRQVREGISYLFDFEFVNKQTMYNSYTRCRSFWENSVFASYLGGLPDEGELKYLNPFKDQVPPEVFTKVYEPPKTDGSGNIRENLKKALELFAQAGWAIKDGKLVNSAGAQLSFEILIYDARASRTFDPFIENCKRAGINASYRLIDYTSWISRIEQFDYDMITFPFGQSFSPGNEQRYFWGSRAADEKGSYNFAGIKNPAVDFLIESLIQAKDFRELQSATRALDRVLLWNHYMIPEWYLNYFRIAYNPARLHKPNVRAPMLAVGIYEIAVIYSWWAAPGQLSK
ncbi:MAG: ABC transporter substrate-binding protein, partial [Spirochaetaceae bacterium]